MALNLGHTFAHALEAVPELDLNHGEAVGLGLLAAAACAERLGIAPRGVRRDLEALLGSEGIGLPIRAQGLPDSARMMGLMLDDKKVAGGRLRLILPTSPGHVVVVDDPPADAVAYALDSIRAA
jgi:shikimate kinase/3-dehydroquinate synthase